MQVKNTFHVKVMQFKIIINTRIKVVRHQFNGCVERIWSTRREPKASFLHIGDQTTSCYFSKSKEFQSKKGNILTPVYNFIWNVNASSRSTELAIRRQFDRFSARRGPRIFSVTINALVSERARNKISPKRKEPYRDRSRLSPPSGETNFTSASPINEINFPRRATRREKSGSIRPTECYRPRRTCCCVEDTL